MVTVTSTRIRLPTHLRFSFWAALVPITFEPAYATRQPDGGWGQFVSDLEVVNIGGEHIQAIDEPYIAKVGAHLSQALNEIQANQGK